MVKLNVGALAQGLWTQLTIHAYRNSPGFVIEFDDDTKKKKKKHPCILAETSICRKEWSPPSVGRELDDCASDVCTC